MALASRIRAVHRIAGTSFINWFIFFQSLCLCVLYINFLEIDRKSHFYSVLVEFIGKTMFPIYGRIQRYVLAYENCISQLGSDI